MPSELSLRKRLALEAARQIRRNNIALHPLRQLFWECTLRCNLSCRHCGSDCRATSAQPDMALNEFLSVVDSITPHVRPHEVNIILTGGEPLLRSDLEACGQALHTRGYPWGLVTNGWLLTPSRLQNLLQAGMSATTVSLDGFEAEHDWLRGVEGSFARASEAIRLLGQTDGLLWDVVSCIHRRNLHQLVPFRNYLVNLGVRNWRISTIFPVGRAAQEPDLALNGAELRTLMEFIRKMRHEGGLHIDFACEGFLGAYEGEVRDHFYSCNAGICIASVLADGSISACPNIRSGFRQGHIRTDSFMDVWEHRFRPFRDRSWARQDDCARCTMFRYCEGNGLHLRDSEGHLLACHYRKMQEE
ncbi:MAG: TIGR04133 family radical SAM/SPASM protein [Bacteroidaceae bacterium]